MYNKAEDIERINKQRLGLFSIINVGCLTVTEQYTISKYEVSIQTGAALTDKRISDINDHDNFSQSISEKNPRYGELTAVYWIWKNCHSEYVGICHYRRKYDISDNELDRYMDEDVDAILRKSENLDIGIKEQFIKSHYKYDWIMMMKIIQKNNPDFYMFINANEDKKEWRTCCIGIYKRNVFDEMCSTLFPILFEFESKRREKKDIYQKRDIAYLYERLIFFYFEYKKNLYNYKEVDIKILDTEKSPVYVRESDTYMQEYIKKTMFEYRLSELVERIDTLQWQTSKMESVRNAINIFVEERQNEDYTWFDYLPNANILDNVIFWYDSVAYFINLIFVGHEDSVVDDFVSFIKMSNTSFTAILLIMDFLGINSLEDLNKMAETFTKKGLDAYAMRFMHKAYTFYKDNSAIKAYKNLKLNGFEQKLDER